MPRSSARPLLRVAAACVLAAACAAAASETALSPDAPPPFAPPPGFGSLSDYCRNGLSRLSDDALLQLYASAAPTSATAQTATQRGSLRGAHNASLAPAALRAPRGCVDGCILFGHGSAGLLAPNLEGTLWSGKCFHPSSVVQNYGWAASPQLTASMVGSYATGDSLAPGGEDAGADARGNAAVLVRYPPGGAQNVGAALFTGGFAGTGASDLSDFLDELRELPGLPGASFACCDALCASSHRACVVRTSVADAACAFRPVPGHHVRAGGAPARRGGQRRRRC
jgi:hypothetical protein